MEANNNNGPIDEITSAEDLEALHVAATNGDKTGFIFLVLRLNLSDKGRRFLANHRHPKRYHQTVLMQAIKRGHLELATFIVDELGPDLEEKCKLLRSGPGAIHIAVKQNQFRIVDLLLSREPKLIEAKNEAGDTPLLCAAEAGLLDMIQYLIDVKEANLEAKNDLGETAFLRAVWSGSLACVQFFIEKGACLDATRENDGFSALHIAAANGDLTIFHTLAFLNPKLVKCRDFRGDTPLHTVAEFCHIDPDILAYRGDYEENGYPDASNPELLDPDDDVGLAFNSEIVFAIRKYEGGLKIAQLLVGNGLSGMGAVDTAGNTVLHVAADKGNTELMHLFLEYAPELFSVKNCEGKTALNLARSKADDDDEVAVKCLVDWQKSQIGSQVNSRKRRQMAK